MRKVRIPRKGRKGKASKEIEDQKRNNHQEVSLLQTGQSLPVQLGVNGQLQSRGLRDQNCCLDRSLSAALLIVVCIHIIISAVHGNMTVEIKCPFSKLNKWTGILQCS